MSVDVKFVIAVDEAGAIRKLTETERALYALQKTSKQTESVFSAFASEWKRLTSSFVTGQFIVDGMKKGLGLLKNEIVDTIKQAADYEKAVKGLDAAFAISGRTMPGMTKRLREYATELERLGLEEDDAILRSESLLLQLTNLDEKGIKAATRGAIGLASVFGMDLQSATESVAKGMEGNFMMLQRLIPAIRNATTEEGKRAAMMKAFEGLYQRAITDTATYAGKVKALALEWKSAKQELGTAVLDTGILQESTTALREFLQELTAYSRKPTLAQIVEQNNKAGESLEKMAAALGWSKREIVGLRMETGLSSSQLLSMIQANWKGEAAAKALAKVLAEEAAALEETKKGFNETGDAVDNFSRSVLKATELTQNTSRSGWLAALGGMSTGVGMTAMPKSFSTNTDVWKKQFEWLGVTTKKTTEKMSDYFAGLYNDIATGFGNAFIAFRFTLTGFKDFFIAIWKEIRDAFFKYVGEMIAEWLVFTAIKGVLNFITGGLFGGVSATAEGIASASGILPMAQGFSGIISRPTPILVGEAGPEYVSVRPMAGAGAGGGTITLNFNAPLIATTGISRSDLERAGADLVAVVKTQLRRVGRSL